MKLLVDLAKLGLVYQQMAPVTTKKYIREHSDVVQALCQNADRSRASDLHRQGSIDKGFNAVLRRCVERDVLEKTREDLLSDSVLPRKQYPSVEGLKTILATEFKGKPAKPEDFFDASFVRELDQSGFTEALYKKQ